MDYVLLTSYLTAILTVVLTSIFSFLQDRKAIIKCECDENIMIIMNVGKAAAQYIHIDYFDENIKKYSHFINNTLYSGEFIEITSPLEGEYKNIYFDRIEISYYDLSIIHKRKIKKFEFEHKNKKFNFSRRVNINENHHLIIKK